MNILNRFAYVEHILILSKIAKREGLNPSDLLKYIDTTKQYSLCVTNRKRKMLQSDKRCIARTWNGGIGDQCCSKKRNGQFCIRHSKHIPHNTIYQEYTEKMIIVRTKLGLPTTINSNNSNLEILETVPVSIDTTVKPPVDTLTLLSNILHDTPTDEIDYNNIINKLNKQSSVKIAPFMEYITSTITEYIEQEIEKEFASDTESNKQLEY